jgi:hypothetical protein
VQAELHLVFPRPFAFRNGICIFQGACATWILVGTYP